MRFIYLFFIQSTPAWRRVVAFILIWKEKLIVASSIKLRLTRSFFLEIVSRWKQYGAYKFIENKHL